MQTRAERRMPSTPLRRALALVATSIASACASAGTAPPAPVEVRGESGFSITEKVRAGARARADFEHAMRLLEQERYQSGIALLVEVTEAAPQLTTAHIDLAIAYGRVGDLARAEASLTRALALNPRHPVALNELGILYRRTGRFAEARQSYEKALEHYPAFHFARRNLAILCDLYLADAGCALAHYEAYRQAVPGDPDVPIWIADLRSRAGQ